MSCNAYLSINFHPLLVRVRYVSVSIRNLIYRYWSEHYPSRSVYVSGLHELWQAATFELATCTATFDSR